jgi:hypothetical protein
MGSLKVEKHCQKALNVTCWYMCMSTMNFDPNNPHVLIKEEVWKLMVSNIFEDVEEATLVLR